MSKILFLEYESSQIIGENDRIFSDSQSQIPKKDLVRILDESYGKSFNKTS